MVCDACNNDRAARIKIVFLDDGTKIERCDRCGAGSTEGVPDLYLGDPKDRNHKGEYTNENICDDNGDPIPYSSKRELARIMKQRRLKVADSAERIHGYRSKPHSRKIYFT